jgi:hypothetical protein
MALAERGIGSLSVSLSRLLDADNYESAGATDVSLSDYVSEIVRSGFPAIRNLTKRALRRQLDGYIARIIDADFEEQGRAVRRPETLMSWLRAYAAATSTTATFETIRDAATGGHGDKPAKTTTLPYREILRQLWIVDPVPPWSPSRNLLNRLGQAAEHSLADPALAARVLGLDAEALLSGEGVEAPVPSGSSLLGNLFESLVTLCIRVYAEAAEANIYHLRLHGGSREIDLIVERGDGKIVAIEVKLSRTVSDEDVKHLRWLRGELGGALLNAVVVNTGPNAYRRSDGVAVVPAALLGV